MTAAERLESLELVLKGCKLSLPWMVDSLAYGKDEGMFSDELRLAIALRETVEALPDKETREVCE